MAWLETPHGLAEKYQGSPHLRLVYLELCDGKQLGLIRARVNGWRKRFSDFPAPCLHCSNALYGRRLWTNVMQWLTSLEKVSLYFLRETQCTRTASKLTLTKTVEYICRCSHAGIVNVVKDAVKQFSRPVYMVWYNNQDSLPQLNFLLFLGHRWITPRRHRSLWTYSTNCEFPFGENEARTDICTTNALFWIRSKGRTGSCDRTRMRTCWRWDQSRGSGRQWNRASHVSSFDKGLIVRSRVCSHEHVGIKWIMAQWKKTWVPGQNQLES